MNKYKGQFYKTYVSNNKKKDMNKVNWHLNFLKRYLVIWKHVIAVSAYLGAYKEPLATA